MGFVDASEIRRRFDALYAGPDGPVSEKPTRAAQVLRDTAGCLAKVVLPIVSLVAVLRSKRHCPAEGALPGRDSRIKECLKRKTSKIDRRIDPAPAWSSR